MPRINVGGLEYNVSAERALLLQLRGYGVSAAVAEKWSQSERAVAVLTPEVIEDVVVRIGQDEAAGLDVCNFAGLLISRLQQRLRA